MRVEAWRMQAKEELLQGKSAAPAKCTAEHNVSLASFTSVGRPRLLLQPLCFAGHFCVFRYQHDLEGIKKPTKSGAGKLVELLLTAGFCSCLPELSIPVQKSSLLPAWGGFAGWRKGDGRNGLGP